MKEGDVVAGRYRLLRPIGAGAMGSVWAARHEMLGRDFALKFASIPARAGPEARARFLLEAQIVGRLRHPNIVDVADVGEVEIGGGLYLAMELLEGESLADRIRRCGPLRVHEALSVAIEVVSGLGAAHAAGVIHRDIKPENIFLAKGTSRGVVPKLLDFGVSKATEAAGSITTLGGQLFGTPAYMSPEQALGETDIDLRTDIWSLGVVLYEMLTGQHPFVAPSYQALLPRIAEQPFEPLPESTPEIVRVIIAHCLAKRREDRYQTTETLREALEDAFLSLGAAEPDSLVIERVRVIPSLAPARPDAAHKSRGSFGTLSPSIAPYIGAPRRKWLGVAALSLAAAIALTLVTVGWFRTRAATSAAALPTSREPVAMTAAPTEPARATAAPAVPTAAPVTTTEPAPANISAPSAATNRAPRKNARPVTRVNSAGF